MQMGNLHLCYPLIQFITKFPIAHICPFLSISLLTDTILAQVSLLCYLGISRYPP